MLFMRMSLLIWINATILEMLLSYIVFHQDKLDASFCRRMFHPPLLASNCFLFSSVKTGISIQLVAIANLNVTLATLLDFSATAQNEIGFPIRVGRFIGDLFASWKVSTCLHPHDRAVCFEMMCDTSSSTWFFWKSIVTRDLLLLLVSWLWHWYE